MLAAGTIGVVGLGKQKRKKKTSGPDGQTPDIWGRADSLWEGSWRAGPCWPLGSPCNSALTAVSTDLLPLPLTLGCAAVGSDDPTAL